MIGWEEVLVNDLFSVERDIKPQVTQLTQYSVKLARTQLRLLC